MPVSARVKCRANVIKSTYTASN